MIRRHLIGAAAIAVVMPLFGCGGGSAPTLPPPVIDVKLIPSTLLDGAFGIAEDESARDAFEQAGDRALVADGRLFAIRDEDRLVGALQVSTLASKVDLLDADHRAMIVSTIIPGTKERIRIADVQVIESRGPDKTVYLWFGETMFQVLQLKPTSATPFDPEVVLMELITHQSEQRSWRPLPEPADGDE